MIEIILYLSFLKVIPLSLMIFPPRFFEVDGKYETKIYIHTQTSVEQSIYTVRMEEKVVKRLLLTI
jgi:hypothetical protein